MIRRKKLTIFTDAKDTTTVGELKQMIEGSFNFYFDIVYFKGNLCMYFFA